MDEIFDELKKMKNFSILLKEIGNDMINGSKLMDEYLRLAADPLQIIFNNNLSEDMEIKMNEININIMMISNKIQVLNEYTNDKKEKEGEEE